MRKVTHARHKIVRIESTILLIVRRDSVASSNNSQGNRTLSLRSDSGRIIATRCMILIWSLNLNHNVYMASTYFFKGQSRARIIKIEPGDLCA